MQGPKQAFNLMQAIPHDKFAVDVQQRTVML